MKFIGILRQDADGCDYSIGCGINTIQFEAENNVDAANKLKSIIFENYNTPEYKLKSLYFYEINATFMVDMDKWYADFEQEMKSFENEQIELAELAELARLKMKYEPNILSRS